jgi:sarcosine oxidase subunit beta
VVVLEKNYLASGATGRCGAGIRQQWSTKENALLAMKSVKRFERLEEELGYEIGLRQGGYLIAVHNEEDLTQAKKNIEMQRSIGLDVALLDEKGIQDVVPILDVHGMGAIAATFCPTDGHADPFKTTYAYAHAAMKKGAKVYKFTEVKAVLTSGKKIKGVQTNRGTINTSVVVNAAGAWSNEVAKMVDMHLPNVPIRKEILVTERMKHVFESMVISFKDGIYFSQQEGGQILGGMPSPEETPGFHTRPTFSFLTHMAKTLARYAPVLKHINVLRQWTGFYDVTPDARPILGDVKEIEGFIQCNGFSGHGFMIAPMVATLLSQLIADEQLALSIETLNLERFETMKIERERSVVG